MRSEDCKLEALHIFGNTFDGGRKAEFLGPWWKKAYHFHRIDSLTSLTLSGMILKGEFRAFQAAILSPIKYLHLSDILFEGVKAVQHVCWPLVYHLQELKLTQVSIRDHLLSPIKPFLEIVGPKLVSFEVDGDTLRSAAPPKMAAMMKLLPIVKHLRVDGAEWTVWPTGNGATLPAFPDSLETLVLSYVTPKVGRALLERLVDPSFLPQMRRLPQLGLNPSEHEYAMHIPTELLENSWRALKARKDIQIYASDKERSCWKAFE